MSMVLRLVSFYVEILLGLLRISKDIQIQRLMKRDNIDENEAKLKISNQMDIEEKRKLSDMVIDNSQNLKHLQNEVERIIGEII